MIRKTTKTALLSAVVLSAAFAAQSASAALITNWNYSVDSGFSSFSGTGGTGGAVTGTGSGLDGDPTTLSWGVPDNTANEQSSISIQSPVTGSVATNDGAAPGATFSHNNRVIKINSISLNSFNLKTQLTLTSTAPPSETGVTPSPLDLTFDSFFTETPNVAGTCVVNDGGTPCSDIFVLSNSAELPGTGQPPIYNQSFTKDGYLYTVALAINNLDQLTDAECDAAGATAGCVGFTTMEGQNNDFTSSFTIAARAVPEPGSLAILGLGLGLIGFGFYARRRNFRA